ncbi:hypothetical protein HNQ71_006960 [Mesorhizobium sangaii]|uniref:Uncharacterized protein n=1 Tax=Mesorhizobium sangaii TaxID=505389 RepID=A0A841PJR4_9HYPH|nr:hypothetical protein [Mesorhizobium sangaii]
MFATRQTASSTPTRLRTPSQFSSAAWSEFLQHCGEAHLHRYLSEFDFRYNRRTALGVTDTERHDQLLAMIEGKRLTYRRIGEASHA